MKYAVLKGKINENCINSLSFSFPFLSLSISSKRLSCTRNVFKDIISLNFHETREKVTLLSSKQQFLFAPIYIAKIWQNQNSIQFCLNPELTFNCYAMLFIMHIFGRLRHYLS